MTEYSHFALYGWMSYVFSVKYGFRVSIILHRSFYSTLRYSLVYTLMSFFFLPTRPPKGRGDPGIRDQDHKQQ
jgi:hypothetical protein